MKAEVELSVFIGNATDENGMTLVGMIEEEIEVMNTADFVEPEIVEYIRENYGVEIEQ